MAGYPASVNLDDPTEPLVGGFSVPSSSGGAQAKSIGDVNGDGIADLLVSVDVAQSYEPDWANYVIYGGARPPADFDLATLDGSNGFRIEARSGWLSSSAISACDINGDGLADLAFITSARVPGQSALADVHVLFGSATPGDGTVSIDELDGDSGFTLTGPTGLRSLNYDLTAGGDINGDGYDELIIGDNGSLGFVFGSDSFAPTAAIDDVAPLDFYRHYGLSAGIGDINGEGYDDVKVGDVLWFGRPDDEPALPQRGPFKDHYSWVQPTQAAYGNTSGDLNPAGDVNGDGYDDFILSRAYTSPHGHAQGGETWVVFGKPSVFPGSVLLEDLDGSDGFVIRGERMERVGVEANGAGDLNGDGFDDVVVTREDGDIAYVIYGRAQYHTPGFDVADLDGTNGFTLTDPGDAFLRSPAGLGDLDGDGFDDLAFGERPYGVDTLSDLHILWGLKPTEPVTRVDGDGDNTVRGGDFDDTLISSDGDDTLRGGLGDDRLVSVAGTDTLDGGLGDDTYVIYRNLDDIIVDAGGTDTIEVKTSFDLADHPEIENLTFSTAGNWRGYGNGLDNEITAGAGNNKLFGGAGDDTLSGGAGRDLLSGGAGRDVLTGGIGADRFDFADFETGLGANRDVITDYADGIDTINLGYMDANVQTASNQSFHFIGETGFSGAAGELRYNLFSYTDGERVTLVEGDTNGDGLADFQVELRGVHTLLSSDFIL